MKENNRIIYPYGITQNNLYFEIQLWPSILYHCFEYSIIHKPIQAVSYIFKIYSLKLRTSQTELQNIIDNNCFAPYHN